MGRNHGPMLMLTETYNIFGYGLGGTHVNIEKILPEKWITFMLIISDAENINIKTLLGRIIAELGPAGLIFFLYIYYEAFQRIKVSNKLFSTSFRVAGRQSIGIFG